MNLRYEQLSERSGVIVDDQDRACILYHVNMAEFPDCEDQVSIRPINVGERPTFLNREAAESWIEKLGDEGHFPLVHPDNIVTKEKPAAFRYRDKAAELLTPEYQLYLAKQLESKTKASKPTFAEAQELTGYLPHEESPQ